ncbi:TonB-dependent receptor plug domain-containing protein [Agrilutibacter niabensis]|uniref:TonB-dependent receptor plug domain-containing protein n=1 Tax=Agrilutibacter niabensis TaxID=380628 RepID=UPI0036DF80FB
MAVSTTKRLQRHALSAALMSAMLLTANAALAQETPQASEDQQATELDKVVVTGSLIPQTTLETFKPVITISAEDIKNRGFNSVQEVLSNASVATGGVQGNQTSASFTQGAETNSLFGLPVGYTKYLIDGRPMANYPALYNGTDTFNNISGIPVELVDRIEILPGGQSSLYGSDAIAGVINIILKKKLDGTAISARAGVYKDGGGQSTRVSLADNFSLADDRLNILAGIQYENRDPIWGYQRDLTKQFNQHPLDNPATPLDGVPVASRDWLVFSPFTSYNFLDPANCANVADAFGGTTGLQTRPGRPAPYCGSMFTPGYRTVRNGKESTQVYTHATFDINDNAQLYADVLYNKETVDYHIGSNFTWWGTSVKWGYFYDPNLDDFFQLQRAFAPEDMAGGWEQSMNHDTSKSYAATFGVNGTFGDSSWDYDLGATRTEYKLHENSWARLADPINDWFETNILGPSQGLDPYFGVYQVYTPDYAAFYQLLPAGAFESFTTRTHSHSKTYDNMVRGQVTNAELFSLPGGDAGLAVAAEWGKEGWEYKPDALLIPDPVTLESQIWGTTSVSGEGDRERYAVTGEMRLPVWDPLTVSVSGRYDSYKAAGRTIDSPTWGVGLEFRPIESLLFRGKIGTAFRAPTISDMFQGASGFYSFVRDDLNCAIAGFDPDEQGCPQQFESAQYFGTQIGNPELEPIDADVWSAGIVWAPTSNFSIGADYHHWEISNEVLLQSASRLMSDEYNCTAVADGGTGLLDPNSGTCQAAFAAIDRNALGALQNIRLTKINIAKRELNAVTVDTAWTQSLGAYGDLHLAGSWTRNLKHEQQTYADEPTIDLVYDEFYTTDPKYKANASATWEKDQFSTTLYANYLGPTGNIVAFTTPVPTAYARDRGVGSYTTLNASLSYEATPDLLFSFVVNNLANRMPDMDLTYSGLTGEPYNSANYDVYGRAYYLEVKYVFNKD